MVHFDLRKKSAKQCTQSRDKRDKKQEGDSKWNLAEHFTAQRRKRGELLGQLGLSSWHRKKVVIRHARLQGHLAVLEAFVCSLVVGSRQRACKIKPKAVVVQCSSPGQWGQPIKTAVLWPLSYTYFINFSITQQWSSGMLLRRCRFENYRLRGGFCFTTAHYVQRHVGEMYLPPAGRSKSVL